MLDEQDKLNIAKIEEIVRGNRTLEKALEGPVKWVGEKGFNECVAHLSKKKGIKNAKALCGYLKQKARKTGQLSTKHMGSKERSKYLKGKKK
jgi:hypothetical protein